MGGKKPTVREEESIVSSKQGGGGGGKLKKKHMVIDDNEYSMTTEISDEPTIQEEQVAPTLAFGKRKSKKGKKRGASLSSYRVGGDSDQEAESVASSKPGKSSARLFTTSVFHTIDDEDNEDGQLSEDNEDPAVAFTGKGNGISFRANLLDEESDADTSVKLEAKAIE
nr:PREDICTED: uncharacterized protein LOC107820501 [Nicotiana tabacum]